MDDQSKPRVIQTKCDLTYVLFLQRLPEPAVGMRAGRSGNLQKMWYTWHLSCVVPLCKIAVGLLG